MSKKLDLSGQKIGMITILSPSGIHQTRKLSTWNCRCDCGKEFVAVGSDLLRLKNQNCGCARTACQPKREKPSSRIVDLVGRKFGRLTVIAFDRKEDYKIYWHVRCECGTEKSVLGMRLRQGTVKSCGCAKRENWERLANGKFSLDDIGGQRFGHLIALRQDTERSRGGKFWLFQCDCGNIKSLVASDVKRGSTRSCGCMRHELWKQSSSTYKGDRYVSPDGYVFVLGHKGHPNANAHGRIAEHILVMSEILGRPLRKGESVHHKNGIRDENRPENLELWVKRQPGGQRVSDRIADAVSLLKLYAPHLLANDVAISEFFVTKETDEVPS